MNDHGPAKLSSLQPADWITLHARYTPGERCMVTGDGTTYTFGEINSRVNRLARALRAHGIERHDRIGILATDSVDYMVLLMASMKVGSTYVPFNYRLAPGEIVTLAMAAKLDGFITMARYAEAAAAVDEACPDMKLRASFDPFGDRPLVADLIEEQPDDSDVDVPTQPEDIISIMFTSGTTGRPKGVMQSMRMVGVSTNVSLLDFGFRRGELRYTASPMFHAAGMGSIYYGIARGFGSLILDQFDPPALLEWIRNGELTGALLMPTMLQALLDVPGIRDQEYPQLRSIVYGGAPIGIDLLRAAIDVFKCDFFNSFGAGTEGAGQTMFYPEDHLRALAGEEHLLGSIGRPMYGVDLRLCDDDLNDVPRGAVGEIHTRSETVMSGYLDDPERTAQAVVNGWFRAGDLAWMDDDGFLFLAGRKSDMIIRGGENVYPVEIEAVLLEHPSVSAVAVVGQPDDYWGEVVVAAIELTAGHQLDEQALVRHCRKRLAGYKVPVRFFAMEDMPRNVNGKLQKFAVTDLVAERYRPVGRGSETAGGGR
ncbi:2-succinylbenzoyl-CoA synthetase [Thermomonospora echinospora]|uniref:2-succinylbenzoyl-CoA synthetase n=1 Tax=Thermomonospora echinospora TaxID=1992 RepID=A0A1H6E2M2_9ACTN|nr:AMP-binding protein [Thermomonospora echinospora]SEG91862.1 2-succinylbenzoyl-CoA synthetase [Thermomonospora echinospora]